MSEASELQVTGKIARIKDVTTRGDWKSVEFGLEVPNEFNPDKPRYALFEISGKVTPDEGKNDKVADFVKFRKAGEEVEVKFNLAGFSWPEKEYKDKKPTGNLTGHKAYANKLSAWSVFGVEAGNSDISAPESNVPTTTTAGSYTEDPDDVDCPF